MSKEEDVKKLMVESLKIHSTLMNLWKEMELEVKPAAKTLNVPKWVFYCLKDFQYYKGLGWLDDNPLLRDSEVKFKDRVAPCFIKLLKIVQLCRQMDCLDFLKEYLDALEEYGISIKIEPSHSSIDKFSDTTIEEIQKVVDEMKIKQKEICRLADILRDEKSLKSEMLDFVPKKDFRGVVGTKYEKVIHKLKVEKLQKWFKNMDTLKSVYTDVIEDKI